MVEYENSTTQTPDVNLERYSQLFRNEYLQSSALFCSFGGVGANCVDKNVCIDETH